MAKLSIWGPTDMTVKSAIAAILTLVVCSCGPLSKAPRTEGAKLESVRSDATARANLADTRAYEKARQCFLDAGLQTSTANPAGGPALVNKDIFVLFKHDAIAAGSKLGKSEGDVMNEFRQLVSLEGSRYEAMPAPSKRKYLVNSVDSALLCLKSKALSASR